jgi:antitoxin component YwqK of YwqJK toxin-antitoxin module
MENKIKILIASDTNYEKVVAEIYIDDKFIALISQENGLDQMEIEFPGNNISKEMMIRKIGLNDFLLAINETTQKLKG